MPAFARTIGIDYSGAETPTASTKCVPVYMAEGNAPLLEVLLGRSLPPHDTPEWPDLLLGPFLADVMLE